MMGIILPVRMLAAGPFPASALPGIRYEGSKACASCHRAIYDKFLRTSMGRSVTPAAATATLLPAVVNLPSLNRRLEVFSRDGQVFQSELETQSGKRVFSSEHPLKWAIGSGDNGITYAVSRNGYLFEAPLSFYTKTQGWDLSPGHQTSDEGFSRPIAAECVVCHTGRAVPVPGQMNRYAEPPFAEAAIGCENCHGPGQLHVAERKRGPGRLPDSSIVNPARLAPRLAEDICMMCHQAGQVRALLPGKEYADFRPGTPLINTVAIAELAGTAKDSALLEHHDSMQLSRCFEAGRGKLSCLTCHDPHEQPASAAAPQYFRAKCLTCHTASSCRLSLEKRNASSPPDNCIGCHMPRRDVGLISHSALTDHTIPRVPGQLRPNSLPSTGGVPGVRIVNAAAGTPPLPLLTRLELAGTLRDREPQMESAYMALLAEAERAFPSDPLVLAILGRRALAANHPDAAEILAKAEKAEADRKGAARESTCIDLGEALRRAGRAAEAVAALERGQTAFPWSKDVRKRLVLALIQAKDYAKAGVALKAYVAEFPEDSFLRGLLNQLESGR